MLVIIIIIYCHYYNCRYNHAIYALVCIKLPQLLIFKSRDMDPLLCVQAEDDTAGDLQLAAAAVAAVQPLHTQRQQQAPHLPQLLFYSFMCTVRVADRLSYISANTFGAFSNITTRGLLCIQSCRFITILVSILVSATDIYIDIYI